MTAFTGAAEAQAHFRRPQPVRNFCITRCFWTVNDVQATTTAQHTLQLDAFDGETYEGALLYVTLSVNKFAFQSIEEVDPIDWWALVGSIGGMWGKCCNGVIATHTRGRH